MLVNIVAWGVKAARFQIFSYLYNHFYYFQGFKGQTTAAETCQHFKTTSTTATATKAGPCEHVQQRRKLSGTIQTTERCKEQNRQNGTGQNAAVCQSRTNTVR